MARVGTSPWPILGTVLALLLSGCASTLDSGLSNEDRVSTPAEPRPSPGVQAPPPEVDFDETTGAIHGTVFNPEGAPIGGVHVSILETNWFAKTNNKGQFAFGKIPPGPYVVRADKDEHKSVQYDLKVEANQPTLLNITLFQAVDLGAGFRDHFHDLWGEATELPLLTRTFEWPWSAAHGGEQAVWACYDTGDLAGTISISRTSVSLPGTTIPHCGAMPFYFEHGKIVPPGTGSMEITVSWASQQYVPTIKIDYGAANESYYRHSLVFTPGETKTIPVEAPMTDHGHQTFSMWAFRLEIRFMDTSGAYVNNGDLIRRLVGEIDVDVTAYKGDVIPPESAHRMFWKDGAVYPVVDASRDMGTQVNAKGNNPWPYRRDPNDPYCTLSSDPCFQPNSGALVPPGTTQLNITLEYSASGPGASLLEEKRLSFRPASVRPQTAELTDLLVLQPTEAELGLTKYVMQLEPGQNDAFYQTKSLWMFLLANVDGEQDAEMEQDCPFTCTITYNLKVDAYNANWRPNYYQYFAE